MNIYIMIVSLIILIVSYIIMVYHKLKATDNLCQEDWQYVMKKLNGYYKVIKNFSNNMKDYIPEEMVLKIEYFNSLLASNDQSRIIESTIAIENLLDKSIILIGNQDINITKWNKKIMDKRNAFYQARAQYNDTSLKMCKLLKMFPTNMIAAIFKFKTYAYFISKE